MLNKTKMSDTTLMVVLAVVIFALPLIMAPFGAGYPDLLQRFMIFGLFAVGFNILFGLTGYLSFGHAAFLGVGSYACVWMYKLLDYNIIPGLVLAVIVSAIFALAIGYISLRRSGIYFSILTLAFAQMMFAVAYSDLVGRFFGTTITNGETGLQVYTSDPQWLQSATDPIVPHLFGMKMNDVFWRPEFLGYELQFNYGFYLSAIFLLIGFYISLRIFRSPFGMMLRAIKSNQNRLNYTGINTKPYTLAAFVISGIYAGFAGGLLAAMDPLAGAERMQWTASGEVVLMVILGGAGTLLGPIFGASLIKYFENIFSKVNKNVLADMFSFMPDTLQDFFVVIIAPFMGKGWHLTLGLMFMLVVIFLPGGVVEGFRRIGKLFDRSSKTSDAVPPAAATQPAE